MSFFGRAKRNQDAIAEAVDGKLAADAAIAGEHKTTSTHHAHRRAAEARIEIAARTRRDKAVKAAEDAKYAAIVAHDETLARTRREVQEHELRAGQGIAVDARAAFDALLEVTDRRDVAAKFARIIRELDARAAHELDAQINPSVVLGAVARRLAVDHLVPQTHDRFIKGDRRVCNEFVTLALRETTHPYVLEQAFIAMEMFVAENYSRGPEPEPEVKTAHDAHGTTHHGTGNAVGKAIKATRERKEHERIAAQGPNKSSGTFLVNGEVVRRGGA